MPEQLKESPDIDEQVIKCVCVCVYMQYTYNVHVDVYV